jgi:hypothetical protein
MNLNKKISVEPFNEITTNVITNFIILVESIVLFTKAVLTVDFYNSDGRIVKRERLELAGDDYSNWGNSDDYIINYVTNYYGLTPAPN